MKLECRCAQHGVWLVLVDGFVELRNGVDQVRQGVEPECARIHRHEPDRRLAVACNHHIVAGLRRDDELREPGLGVVHVDEHRTVSAGPG